MDVVYLPIKKPVIIHTDSKGGQSLAKRSANFSKVQHLLVRYHWLREAVHGKEIEVVHVPGSENPADIFTKALSSVTLGKHLIFLGVPAQGEC